MIFPFGLTFADGAVTDLGSLFQSIGDNPDAAASLEQFTNNFQTAFSDKVLTLDELTGLGADISAIADHVLISSDEVSSFDSLFQNVTLTPQLLGSVFQLMGNYQAALSDQMLTEQELIGLGVGAVDVLASAGVVNNEILSLFATAGEILGIPDVFQSVISSSDILAGI